MSCSDYLERTSHADLLIVLAPSGETLARTDAITSLEVAGARTRWIDPLLAEQAPDGFVTTTSGVYHASVEAAEAGGAVFGFLLAARE